MNITAMLALLVLPVTVTLAVPTTPSPTNLPAIKPPSAGAQPTVVKSVIPLEVFKTAGLGKLSADEMRTLNTWLEDYVAGVDRKEQVRRIQAWGRVGVRLAPEIPPISLN